MKITPVSFHLTLSNEEKAYLEHHIEYYYVGNYGVDKRLFSDVSKTCEVLDILRQIKSNNIFICCSWYQAKLLEEIIYSRECRLDAKTSMTYLPADFEHRDLYDAIAKLAKREV